MVNKIKIIKLILHKLSLRLKRISLFKRGLILVFLTWGIYFAWIWTRMIFYKDGEVYAGWYKMWADWSAHYAIAAVFKFRDMKDWFNVHPLFINSKFSYPFLADAITGLIWRLGATEVEAFLISSLVYSCLFLAGVYCFYYYLTKNIWESFLGISLIMLSGGLGFVIYLKDYFLKDLPPLKDLEFTNLRDNYAINFINITTSELIPQRAFLLAIPLTLIILLMLWKNQKEKIYKNAVKIGLLASLLMFLHPHSLIVVVIISAVFAIYNYKNFRFYAVYALTAGIVLLPIYFKFFNGEIGSGFFKWFPGWLANKEKFNVNWFYFWFLNWGLVLPFAITSIIIHKLYKNPLIMGALIVFGLSNLFLFQPHDWDNTKLLTYVYIILLYPIVLLIGDFWRKKQKWAKVWAIVMVVLLSFSGFLDLVRFGSKDLQTRWWKKEELLCAEKINKVIKSGEVVVVGDNHTNIVPTHTRAQIISGFTGWLWTYGINYHQEIKDLSSFYQNPNNRKIIEKYKIKYAVVSNYEIDRFKSKKSLFSKYPKAVECKEHTMYKIQ